MSTGRYSVPNVFSSMGSSAQVSQLDQDMSYLQGGLNAAYQFGTLAARPSAGSAGALYLATDASGGTLYLDNGSSWIQCGGGVSPFILVNYINGLTSSYVNGTTLQFSPGQASNSSNFIYMSNGSFFTKTTSTFLAGSGNGMLDTGSISASNWYHTYIISNSTGSLVDFTCSISPASPSMPVGYTFFRRTGSFLTNGSSQIILFFQIGNYFQWSPSRFDYNATCSSTKNNVLLPSVPNGIQVIADLRIAQRALSGTTSPMIVSSPSISESSPNGIGTFNTSPLFDVVSPSANITATMQARVLTNTSSQVSVQSATTDGTIGNNIITKGWFDISRDIGL